MQGKTAPMAMPGLPLAGGSVRWLCRSALITLLLAGLMLPRLGMVLVELVPGITQAVVCTGDRLIVIALDARGAPVNLPDAEDASDCVSTKLAALGSTKVPIWVALALAPANGPRNLAAPLNSPRLYCDLRPCRAPPLARA